MKLNHLERIESALEKLSEVLNDSLNVKSSPEDLLFLLVDKCISEEEFYEIKDFISP